MSSSTVAAIAAIGTFILMGLGMLAAWVKGERDKAIASAILAKELENLRNEFKSHHELDDIRFKELEAQGDKILNEVNQAKAGVRAVATKVEENK